MNTLSATFTNLFTLNYILYVVLYSPSINIQDKSQQKLVFHASFRPVNVVLNTYNNWWAGEIHGPTTKTLTSNQNFFVRIHFTGSNFEVLLILCRSGCTVDITNSMAML